MTSTINDLLEIEAIKQLKAEYFLYLDTKRWDAFAKLFTEDLRVEGSIKPVMVGREEFVSTVRKFTGQSCHHGHMPIIKLTGKTTARGLWAMVDDLRFEGANGVERQRGYGYYDEEYRKEGEVWRICFLRLSRLFGDGGRVAQGSIPAAPPSWLAQRD